MGADLAALCGYLSYRSTGRTIGADVLANGPGSWEARQRATPEQARALGYALMAFDLFAAEQRLAAA